MIFHPKNEKRGAGAFILPKKVCAACHPCLDKPVLKEFFQSFAFGASVLDTRPADGYTFTVGETAALPLDGCAYSLRIDESGIALAAESEQALIHGFMTLLDRFTAVDLDGGVGVEIEACEITDRAAIGNRMVHFCVFPETELWEIQRFVRLAGALKYTHLVLEFWGMLRYDCLGALAWDSAFEKAQIAPIVKEANDLGIEIVPMFNQWGHATACRVMHGKHVVLDQDPSLQTYFTDDGWCWDIRKPKVRALLRKVREELCALCGEGSYFHVGCDEAYNFSFSEESMDFITDFLNEVAEEMRAKGRRIIAWGDMFLYRRPSFNKDNVYCCGAPSAEKEAYMLTKLDKSIIIADWQYDAKHFPVETASVFAKAGFDTMLCPWDCGFAETSACTKTAKAEGLFGILHTTWHTLSRGMPYVLLAAVQCLEEGCAMDFIRARTCTAALLRKVMPACGDYERAGFSKKQIGFSW